VLVRAADPDRLAQLLRARGATVTTEDPGRPVTTEEPRRAAAGAGGVLLVRGADAAAIGDLALRAGIALRELTPRSASLEEAFMELTEDSVEYGARRPVTEAAR
jgi:ABC-2 type transport system ATP-binding protein